MAGSSDQPKSRDEVLLDAAREHLNLLLRKPRKLTSDEEDRRKLIEEQIETIEKRIQERRRP